MLPLRASRRRRDEETQSVAVITTAQRGLSQEQGGRTRRYLLSMGIRTACVIGAIVTPGWPRWAFIAGAVLLPMLAVIAANDGQAKDSPAVPPPMPAAPPALEGRRPAS